MARKQTPRQFRADIADDLTDDDDDENNEDGEETKRKTAVRKTAAASDDDSDTDSDPSSGDNSDYDVHDDFMNGGNKTGSKAKNGKLEASAGGEGK